MNGVRVDTTRKKRTSNKEQDGGSSKNTEKRIKDHKLIYAVFSFHQHLKGSLLWNMQNHVPRHYMYCTAKTKQRQIKEVYTKNEEIICHRGPLHDL